MNVTFVPESDDSAKLGPKDIALHQEMIGMLCWATKLGRVDILHEITMSGCSKGKPHEAVIKNFQLFREETQVDPLHGSQPSSGQ